MSQPISPLLPILSVQGGGKRIHEHGIDMIMLLPESSVGQQRALDLTAFTIKPDPQS